MSTKLKEYFHSINAAGSTTTPVQQMLKHWANLFLFEHYRTSTSKITLESNVTDTDILKELKTKNLFYVNSQDDRRIEEQTLSLFSAIFKNDNTEVEKILPTLAPDALKSCAIFECKITPLFLAAQLGNIDIFKTLAIKIFDKLSIEEQLFILKRWTFKNKVDVLTWIYENFENKSIFWSFDHQKENLFDIACRNNHEETKAFLLKIAQDKRTNGIVARTWGNSQWEVSGITPLMQCVQANRLDQVRVLVEQLKVDPNELDEDNMTALSWACDRGFEDIILYFINRGSKLAEKRPLEISLTDEDRDNFKLHTDVDLIARSPNPSIIKKICSQGVKIDYDSVISIVSIQHSQVIKEIENQQKEDKNSNLKSYQLEYESLIAYLIFNRNPKSGDIKKIFQYIDPGFRPNNTTLKYLDFCEGWVRFTQYKPSILNLLTTCYSNNHPKVDDTQDLGQLLVFLYDATEKSKNSRQTLLGNIGKAESLKTSKYTDKLIDTRLNPQNSTLRRLCLSSLAAKAPNAAENRLPLHIRDEELPHLRASMK